MTLKEVNGLIVAKIVGLKIELDSNYNLNQSLLMSNNNFFWKKYPQSNEQSTSLYFTK